MTDDLAGGRGTASPPPGPEEEEEEEEEEEAPEDCGDADEPDTQEVRACVLCVLFGRLPPPPLRWRRMMDLLRFFPSRQLTESLPPPPFPLFPLRRTSTRRPCRSAS